MNKTIVVSIILAICFLVTTVLAETQASSTTTEDHFGYYQTTVKSYVKKDMKKTAEELRKFGSFLNLEIESSKEETKILIKASADEMEELAKKFDASTEVTRTEIDQAFARAYQRLSQKYYEASRKSWVKKDVKKAGEEMNEAEQYLENGAKAINHKVTPAVVSTFHKVVKKLTEGKDWVEDETGKAMDDLGTEIKKLGDKISNDKPAK